MNEIRLYAWELSSMPEYSTSIPTGTTVWKQWRRRVRGVGLSPPTWIVGQYTPCEQRDMVAIRWSCVVLKHGPAPRRYTPPDWNRDCYYSVGGFDHGQKYDHTPWESTG